MFSRLLLHVNVATGTAERRSWEDKLIVSLAVQMALASGSGTSTALLGAGKALENHVMLCTPSCMLGAAL